MNELADDWWQPTTNDNSPFFPSKYIQFHRPPPQIPNGLWAQFPGAQNGNDAGTQITIDGGEGNEGNPQLSISH